jgi:predicted RNA-binding protein with PIN domain
MLLIDGHNLIGSGVLPITLSDPNDEAKLIHWLQGYHMLYPNETLQVVFDAGQGSGNANAENYDGVLVRYAPRGTTADQVIMRALEKVKHARHITVVSSDNAVRKAAQVHGAKVLSSQEFAVQLMPKPRKQTVHVKRKPEKPEDPDTAYWLAQFKNHKPPPLPVARKPSKPSAAKPARASSRKLEQPPCDDEGKPINTDVHFWLNEFGKRPPPPPLPREDTKRATAQRKPQKKSAEVEDIEYWLRAFTQPR